METDDRSKESIDFKYKFIKKDSKSDTYHICYLFLLISLSNGQPWRKEGGGMKQLSMFGVDSILNSVKDDKPIYKEVNYEGMEHECNSKQAEADAEFEKRQVTIDKNYH